MNIAEFLEARIAEDEAAARVDFDEMARSSVSIQFDCETQARFDPARVLAECEAKRAIVELHDALEDRNWQSGKDHDFLWCGSCGTLDDAPVPYPCETLEALAAVYKEHPDYQQEWGK